MRRWSFAKGHGTENDFVILLDRESMLDVGPSEVRFICDRRAGIGADGLLRAVLARHVDGWQGDGGLWYMDYRNADGSIAEMCGNGLQVFVRFLLDQDLVRGPVVKIATRSGLKVATAPPNGTIRVSMGPVTIADRLVVVTTARTNRIQGINGGRGQPPRGELRQNPDDLPLYAPPRWHPTEEFPLGVNLEFVRSRGLRHIAMRVYERGVGETRSCGTGTVAAAAAARVRDQDRTPLPVTYQVDTPGGSVEVELTEDEAYLTGPAVLVAHGELDLPDGEVLETETSPSLRRASPARPSH